jgi:hypothetical protein
MAPAICFLIIFFYAIYSDVFHISQAMLLHEIGGMNEYVCMYVCKATYAKAGCLKVHAGNQKLLPGKFLFLKVRALSFESHG